MKRTATILGRGLSRGQLTVKAPGLRSPSPPVSLARWSKPTPAVVSVS